MIVKRIATIVYRIMGTSEKKLIKYSITGEFFSMQTSPMNRYASVVR